MEDREQAFMRVWAPTLVSYTRWVLEEALALNIHRLYFLARDAYMCYKIACKIAAEGGMPISCHYLEGSRYAWRMAEFALADTDAIDRICVGGIHVTLRKILKRGGLTDKEAEAAAVILGKREELDVQLSYEGTQRLKSLLADCGMVRQMIKQHGTDAYEITMRYFIQEGLFEPEPFAIVDSGWVGSLQQTLQKLLRSGGQMCDLKGFYFGLYELPNGINAEDYHTYYFRPYKDIEKKVRFSNCLFEAVCSAGKGMTIGYREEGSRIAAVYETEKNPNRKQIIQNKELLEKQLAVPAAIEEYSLSKREIRKRLERLMGYPTRQEAINYGSYLFSDDVSASSLQSVAAVLTQEEMKNLHVFRRFLIMKGLIKQDLKDSAWPEGSAVLAGGRIGYHLFHIRMYKRLIYLRKKFKNRKI